MRLNVRLFALLVLSAFVFLGIPAQVDAAPPSAGPETYVVQSGDTLFAIALKFKTSIAEIKKLNGLGNNDIIVVGQKLLIPASDSPASAVIAATNTISYTVQPGDTLARIASRYGTGLRALAELNGIPNPNLLAEGQGIAIPSDPALVKPGLMMDPLHARQGGTIVIQVERPDLTVATGLLNSKPLKFTRAGGYYYALLGISRCAKLGEAPLTIVTTDANNKPTTDNLKLNVAATAFPVNAITLPPTGVSILQNTTLVNREAADLATIINQHTPTRLWRGAFRQPVYTAITENFGTRRSYNGGPVSACGHEGTDFRMSLGDPIYSDARGKVVFAALTQVRGNMVVVDHGLGVFSAYYHMSEIAVKVGQLVNAGALIGKAGSTGLSTGPHLHWSMWVNGEYVDPMEWTRRVIP
ncbi:MAG: LysM peptidoglycan-binding domain-containing M23 family metallopeptidase [Chloroflexi bacterium]|nr:LysM peptidoglycan-binding domain-containing M23 family metallopeptidase [Chloroflexota bacterium]